MADISYENLLVNKIQATKIKGRMSLKQYCLTDTGDEAENERRKRLLEEYSDKNKERINRKSLVEMQRSRSRMGNYGFY